MVPNPILQRALSLSPDGRVRLIDLLIESMVTDRSAGELDEIQRAELLRRLAADRAEPGEAIPWEQARQQLKRPA